MGNGALYSMDQTLSTSVTFPQNLRTLVIEMTYQGQSGDEFWWSCVPTDLTSQLGGCGGTAFRMARVDIDGVTVAIHSVYPYLFTGGVDPYLWEPTPGSLSLSPSLLHTRPLSRILPLKLTFSFDPGVQTLHLLPFRLDLTPFIPLLTDGQSHTIDIGINGDDVTNGWWTVFGNILYTVDEGMQVVTGKVTQIFRTEDGSGLRPNVNVYQNGTVTVTTVTYRAIWSAESVLSTSNGPTEVYSSGEFSFSNSQYFDILGEVFLGLPNSYYINEVSQNSFDILNSSLSGVRQLESPFHGVFRYTPGQRVGTFTQYTNIDLSYDVAGESRSDYLYQISNRVESEDTLYWTSALQITGKSDTLSTQKYSFHDTLGNGWSRNVTSADNVGKSEETRKDNLIWWCDPYLGYNVPPSQ